MEGNALYYKLLVLVFLSFVFTGAAGCQDECSLNGECVNNTCICDMPWTGVRCEKFATLPSPTKAVYGYSPNVSSWGGSTIYDDKTKLHHLYAAQMKTGGLSGWRTQSECIHATASTVEGPYTLKGVVLPSWCHGPQIVRHKDTGMYMMVHVGSGYPSSSSMMDAAMNSSFMHISPSPNGPWTAAATSPGGCNMPTAAFHPNGTLYAVCGNGYSITHVLNATTPPWLTSWADHTPLHPKGDDGAWEDPDLWWDHRGNWHILYHVFPLGGAFNYTFLRYSGHAWSRDGINWTYSNYQPYTGTVEFTDGTSTTYSTRERPHLIFKDDARTTPIGVITAVSSQPVGPECNTCYENKCNGCKTTKGRDWTYTVFQPFQGFGGGGGDV